MDDLVRLRAFIAGKNPNAAARAAETLLTGIERLSDFPALGRPVSRAPDPESLRDLVLGTSIVRYVPRPETIIILRVWHQHELPPGAEE